MKTLKSLLVCLMSFSMVSCNTNTPSESLSNKPNEDTGKIEDVWNDEYQDANNSFNQESIESAKLFYKGDYVNLNTSVSKRKDVKYEFYTKFI